MQVAVLLWIEVVTTESAFCSESDCLPAVGSETAMLLPEAVQAVALPGLRFSNTRCQQKRVSPQTHGLGPITLMWWVKPTLGLPHNIPLNSFISTNKSRPIWALTFSTCVEAAACCRCCCTALFLHYVLFLLNHSSSLCQF